MADEGLTAEEIVQACNTVIVYAGLIARVATIQDVRAVCSSTGLLVAALEGIIQQRIEGIIRNPSTPAERAYNNNLVVDILSKVLGTDLSHIAGERIVEGFVEDISNLLELLAALCQGRPLLGPPQPEHEGEDKKLDAKCEEYSDALREDLGYGEDVAGEQAHQLGAEVYSDQEDSGNGSPGDDARAVNADEAGYSTETIFPEPRAAQAVSSYEVQPDAGRRTGTPELEQHCSSSPSSEQERGHGDVFCPPEQQMFVLSGGTTNDAFGSRRRARRRRVRNPHEPAQQHPGPNPLLRLSPIQELSREGGESALNSKRATPRIHNDDVVSAPANGRPRQAPPRVLRYTLSSGGGSSVISIPTDLANPRRMPPYHPPVSSGHQSPQELRSAVPEIAYGADASGDSSCSPSDNTVRMMANALTKAQAMLRGEEPELNDSYSGGHSLEAEAWGAMHKGSSNRLKPPLVSSSMSADGLSDTAGSLGSRRAAGGHRPQHAQSGSLEQERAFMRKVKRALSGNDSAGAAASVSTQSSLPKQKPAGRAGKGTKGPGTGGNSKSKHAAAAPSRVAARDQDVGRHRVKDIHAQLLQPLRGSSGAEQSGRDRVGRKMLRSISETYGSALPLPSREHSKATAASDAANGLKPAVTQHKSSMRLSNDLEAKLKYVCRLAAGDPKQLAAREAVQRVALREEHTRHTRRRELVERLSSARSRRDATLQMTTHRLREQSLEHEKRVEQLRLQRLAAEWSAKQRSAQMRRALQAELALRDAFLEVLEREKEALLEERHARKSLDALPHFKSAMRKADQEYQNIFRLLEDLLAAERQQRMAAWREAQLAQRQGKELAATVVHDRLQELLGCVAREEEAHVDRHSLATRPQAREDLVAQMRQLLNLS